MSEFTWPVAFTVLGGIIVFTGAVLTYYGRKRDPDAVKALSEIELIKSRLSQHDLEIQEALTQNSSIKNLYERDALNNKEVLSTMDKKLEKIGDLIIELIRSQN